jgi:hypothetical protein
MLEPTWKNVADRMFVIAVAMASGWKPDADAKARINGYFTQYAESAEVAKSR